ncbi:MAG: DUF5615 family PIN-like protein [Planctomycetota bacterium]
MKVWIDAQLPPSLVRVLSRQTGVEAKHLFDLGLGRSKDEAIYSAARAADVILVSKDFDFVRLLERLGPPPRILWITLGNVRNRELAQTLELRWEKVLAHFESGEPLVELGRIPEGR